MSILKPVQFANLRIGHKLEIDDVFYFFGNKHATLDRLQQLFPNFEFSFLKQIHSNKVVEKTVDESPIESPIEADGHWTEIKNKALVIRTADCNPILWHNQDIVVALHAGWRGVEANIAKASIQATDSLPQTVVIGPAIGFKNFEVGNDVAERLTFGLSEELRRQSLRQHSNALKKYINLSTIIISQFTSHTDSFQFLHLDHDTFSHPEYFSYRRQAEEQGRNLSFIAKTSKIDKIKR